jgi:hypothetical protein
MKLIKLIKIRLNETCSKVRIGKYLFKSFLIENCLKEGDALSSLLFNVALKYAVEIGQNNFQLTT